MSNEADSAASYNTEIDERPGMGAAEITVEASKADGEAYLAYKDLVSKTEEAADE